MNSLKYFIDRKKEKANSQQEINEILMVEKWLQNETVFLEIDMDTAIGILSYLEVPENKILDYYFEMISIDKFQKMPKKYLLIDPDDIKTK